MDEKYNAEWYAKSVSESKTGKLLVPYFLVKKYRVISGNYEDDSSIIRANIINECQNEGWLC